MQTKVKTQQEIKDMRTSGHMLATVLQATGRYMQAGMTTKDLADFAAKELRKLGGKPAFLGYHGFPDVLCVSVNEEIIHGIPNRQKVIQEGDIISMDFGVIYNGMITDSAISKLVGNGSSKNKLLIKKTQEALFAGLDVVKKSVKIGTIGAHIEPVLISAGLGVVREYVGHGVGHNLHESPNIPNYGIKGEGESLLSGMTVAIEPMATLGSELTTVAPDGWTVVTQDGSYSAHFEHTILVTDDGCEILTSIDAVN